ncbi:metallophosphoesterase [Marinobacter salicampi]|uniref:metallophosphoesterase n=1 Tax=Marinobacter salicampi TaxID=435907 RepID=UPI00140990BA|nr:metallophosphoesterase [Marinobacter salicampi]
MTARAYSQDPDDELLHYRLSLRLGAVHARQRLGIERDTEARVFGRDHHSFHLENIYSAPGFIRTCLRLVGMLKRGQNNSRRLRTVDHQLRLPGLPPAFEGFRLLHLTDLHVDMDPENLQAVIDQITPLQYDLCVLTGDYRRLTWGPIEEAQAGMARLRKAIKGAPLAVLGNHDSIRMVPGLEDMGYRVLLNEHLRIERGNEYLYIAGVDDPHFYKVHNLQRAADDIPADGTSILLSHSPEIWREAVHAGFDAFLCGHTHGGQICLPGGFPLTLDADCPRALGRGHWQRGKMQGYTSPGAGTSVVNVRLNCPPEVTMHTLTRAG